MLSKKEKMIMQFILNESGNRDTCLLLPIDIEHALAPKFTIINGTMGHIRASNGKGCLEMYLK